jgi:hypothetical protein
VSQLQPEELHRLILHRGLEGAAEWLMLATPAQLAGVFDLDLWRPDRVGGDVRFDAGRFGEWLDALVAHGADGAATLAALDPQLVAAGLAQHVRVFDRAVVDPYISLEGVETPTGYGPADRPRCDVGGYAVFARRSDAWEAVTAVLTALEHAHGDYFARLMRTCTRLSDTGREIDGLDDLLERGDQTLFDLAVDREDRLDAQGYVAPARARVFLQMARRTSTDGAPQAGLVARGADPIAAANAELAFLANTLIAGTSVQGRSLQPDEVPAAVAAVCTLGREQSPASDLVSAFQAGWARLHEDVGMYAADRLLSALTGLPRHDDDTDAEIHALRMILTKHLRAGTPWCARDALDALATLDLPTWAALRGMMDEFPVLPAAVHACLTASTRAVSATAFEFISSSAQIQLIQAFADSLGERLGGRRPG